ncbi:alpha-keto acid decarboxylase family protein [Lignipirellula cremea]|uniref:Indole-3-pyruvate decarboxylase n=1 Tax=Lignipirellula cremea TaxID=2528010 RepID=A0A518E010_9BACT|nr:thiamine pyrophosphate-dependent enzyme [Lignipirellula cremea]QDU97391.1 Indole-3-pyruvate decarboxylase [Lignipirellula cremea]
MATHDSTHSPAALSIGQYLIQRLQDYGIGHVFGIPGDYVLTFYGMLEKSAIKTVGCTREDNAGFAADAYARVNGMGAVCVTYCVGGLSVCNSIAGAFAEKSPVVVISGSPGMSERDNNPLLHHKVREFHTQMDVFEKLCIAGAELHDPATAFREIDRVLDAASRFKRPVYLELPRDMVEVVPQTSPPFSKVEVASDPQAMSEACDDAVAMLAKAQKPIILAGVEVHRFGLQDQLVELAERSNIPIAATLLGKSVVRETHPLYVGIYEGAMGREEVTRFVEESDCVLLLGAFMTDINLGIYTADLNPNKCIYATSEQLRIRHHHFHGVQLGDFMQSLTEKLPPTTREIPPGVRQKTRPFELKAEAPITISRMIALLNDRMEEDTIVIADIGDSLFSATDLIIQGRTEFISPAYYTSMGFSTPAALGAHFARPDGRPLVICGDGAFQMTGQEFSTMVRHKIPAVMIILDNHGYGTERFLHPGDWEYNEILPWNYSKLPEVYGGGRGYQAATEGEFAQAMASAWDDLSGPSLIQVKIGVEDSSQALIRLAERLSKRV